MRRSLSISIALALLAAPIAGRAQTSTAPADSAPSTRPSQRVQEGTLPQTAPPATKPTAPSGPSVTVYGTINVNTQWVRSRGATVGTPFATAAGSTAALKDYAPRIGVSTDSSNFGLRAQTPINDWVKAEAQCETSANVDGIATNSVCNRNSRIALSGGFGTLWYGNWDTPFKAMIYGTKADDPFFSTDVYAWSNLMGSPGFNYKSSAWKGATGDVIQGFDIRAQNSIGYWTPNLFGLTGRFQYGTNEFKSVNGAVSPKLLSAALIYDRGPLALMGSYENHEQAYGLAAMNAGAAAPLAATGTFGATAPNTATAASPHSEDWGWRVGVGYELSTPLGATTPSFVFEQLKYTQGLAGNTPGAPAAAVGSLREYDRYAWTVALKHRAGNHELRGRYAKANDGSCERVGGATCTAKDFGAENYTVGWAYHLAKSAQVYVHWTHILNRRNAQYTFNTAGPALISAAGTVRGTVLPGQDLQALGLGMRYAF